MDVTQVNLSSSLGLLSKRVKGQFSATAGGLVSSPQGTHSALHEVGKPISLEVGSTPTRRSHSGISHHIPRRRALARHSGELTLSASQSLYRYTGGFPRKSTRARSHSAAKALGRTKSGRERPRSTPKHSAGMRTSQRLPGHAAAQQRGARGLLWRIPTRVSTWRPNTVTRTGDRPSQRLPGERVWTTCG